MQLYMTSYSIFNFTGSLLGYSITMSSKISHYLVSKIWYTTVTLIKNQHI